MNAYVSAFDPHGIYIPPPGQRTSRAGEPGHVGVGLVLKKQGEWITVLDMTGDGAAWRSGQLHSGDRIVGVAQGAGQPMTDVVGWDVDEVVALLRGVPGSTVVLNVSPASAQGGSAPRSVALVRGQAAGPDNVRHPTAKLEVLDRSGTSYRIGVVTIPTFYEDFAAKRAGVSDYTSMTRDVAALLATLKAQRADAVLLDLRRDGGGSLTEAVGLAGLFLPRAPVVQQRKFDGKTDVEFTPGSAPVWDGPLAVLIDEGSAAATEIFAAAIQDHGRGLVIGDRSAGRSSMQTMISLDRFASNSSEHYGELKMTVAQLYRVSGETFEQAGVIPDIYIPGMPAPNGNAHQLAFPTKPISAAVFSPRGEVKAVMPVLSGRHETRTAADNAYQAMLRGRTQPSGSDAPAGADIARVQLGEALNVVGDQVELLRASPAVGH
jgi:carboxyl-terminal processing protease